MKNKSRLFRSSMNGFNKEDVNKYIISMNNEFAAKEEDYKREISTLKEKLAVSTEWLEEATKAVARASELEEKLQVSETAVGDLEEKLTNCENERSTAAAKAADIEEKLHEFELTVSNMKEMLTEAENAKNDTEEKLSELARENEELKKALDSKDLDLEKLKTAAKSEKNVKVPVCKENDSDSKKVRLYDELRGNIGDIILNANKNADTIVRNAERRAYDIDRSNREKTDAVRRRLMLVTGRTIASLKKKAIRNADSYLKEFKSYSNDISSASKTMTADLERRYAELNSKLANLGTELEKDLRTSLLDFDKGCSSIKSGMTSENNK